MADKVLIVNESNFSFEVPDLGEDGGTSKKRTRDLEIEDNVGVFYIKSDNYTGFKGKYTFEVLGGLLIKKAWLYDKPFKVAWDYDSGHNGFVAQAWFEVDGEKSSIRTNADNTSNIVSTKDEQTVTETSQESYYEDMGEVNLYNEPTGNTLWAYRMGDGDKLTFKAPFHNRDDVETLRAVENFDVGVKFALAFKLSTDIKTDYRLMYLSANGSNDLQIYPDKLESNIQYIVVFEVTALSDEDDENFTLDLVALENVNTGTVYYGDTAKSFFTIKGYETHLNYFYFYNPSDDGGYFGTPVVLDPNFNVESAFYVVKKLTPKLNKVSS